MKALFIIILSITCSWRGTAQENSDNAITQNNKDHLSDPKYAPMLNHYVTYYDAYLYILNPERRIDLLNWYNQGNEKIVEQRLQRFENRLREVETMTQSQLDSIMKIPPIEERQPTTQVKLMHLDEEIFAERAKYHKELIELFRGYPVYVVTTAGKLPNSNVETSSTSIYFPKTMTLLYRIVIDTAQ